MRENAALIAVRVRTGKATARGLGLFPEKAGSTEEGIEVDRHIGETQRGELPFTAGLEGSFEFGEEVVAEGPNFIDAGLTAATPLKTAVSFAGGKFAVAVSGQDAQFVLVELPAPEVTGDVRARFILMAGSMKP